MNTPRTDAVASQFTASMYYDKSDMLEEACLAMTDLARQLERELAAAQAEIERLRGDIQSQQWEWKERAEKAEAEAQRYRESIINLLDVKGRYHTEIATKALFALVDNAARGNL